MSRSKANTEVKSYARLRFQLLLDEYIEGRPKHVLPELWGRSPSWRRYNASLLAEFSRSPDLLTVLPENISQENGSRQDLRRQILFATLFATAPDYFLAFVSHFRRASLAKSQIEIVAQMILSEGDQLLIASCGRVRSDKEIAVELESRKELRLRRLSPSVVGKARKVIAEWFEREGANRINRYLDEGEVILNGLDAIRSYIESAERSSE